MITRAGTSKGAFFHHVGFKRDLGRALTERHVTADIGRLRWALDEAVGIEDPAERVVAFARCFKGRPRP